MWVTLTTGLLFGLSFLSGTVRVGRLSREHREGTRVPGVLLHFRLVLFLAWAL
jgi:hypothetical protein